MLFFLQEWKCFDGFIGYFTLLNFHYNWFLLYIFRLRFRLVFFIFILSCFVFKKMELWRWCQFQAREMTLIDTFKDVFITLYPLAYNYLWLKKNLSHIYFTFLTWLVKCFIRFYDHMQEHLGNPWMLLHINLLSCECICN